MFVWAASEKEFRLEIIIFLLVEAFMESRKLQIGVPFFDERLMGGIPFGDMSCFSSPDDRTGSLVLSHFLVEGLKRGETVALITFDQVQMLLQNFSFHQFDVYQYFKSGQFILLNFQPNIRQQVGFLQNYDRIFSEIQTLAEGKLPQRIAIHGVDALLNIANIQMTHVTAEKLGSACRLPFMNDTTVLAHFVNYADTHHQHLAIALEKVSAAYFSLNRTHRHDSASDIEFQVKKAPWYNFINKQSRFSEENLLNILAPEKKDKISVAA